MCTTSVLACYQAKRCQVLLAHNFPPIDIDRTEVRLLQDIIKLCKKYYSTGCCSKSFLTFLTSYKDFPLALCLFNRAGLLQTAVPFTETEEGLIFACRNITDFYFRQTNK